MNGFPRRVMWAAVFVCAVGWHVGEAAAIRILPLGDSITHGNGSRDTAGYRQHFNQLLEGNGTLDYVFVGDHPVPSITPLGDWDRYFALPGGSADTPDIYIGGAGNEWQEAYWVETADGDIIKTRSLLDRFVDRTDPTFTTLRQEIPDWVYGQPLTADTVPNLILLHIGTNQVNDPSYGPEAAAGTLADLLSALDFVSTQQDGSGNPYLDPNVQIVIAKIIPDADNPLATAVYNAWIDTLVDDLPAHLRNRTHTIDLFMVNADVFTENGTYLRLGGDARFGAYADFMNLIDTDDDPYLDWVDGLNEADPLAGAYAYNPNLYVDAKHPNRLGYELMAELWYMGLMNTAFIPEPASILLLLVGAVQLLRRQTSQTRR